MLRGILVFILASSPLFAPAKPLPESRCHGTPRNGGLENAWRLPISGPNFSAYAWLGVWMGRTYVHSRVHRVLLSAYEELEQSRPDVTWVYGETGGPRGGTFRPHITHQNGLSVDHMVPVIDREGRSVPFPAHLWNRLGYDMEFDARGESEEYRIDFEAIAEHLYQLDRAARDEAIGIRLVIFDPELRIHLHTTRRWKYLAKRIRFSKHPTIVRHDEHYHVDFEVPCL